MPFRRWFADRGARHPTAYSMITLAAGMLVSMAIAVVISVNASNRAIEQNREQEQRQRQEARAASCYLINSQVSVYEETPPSTPTGREAAQAWAEAARVFGCTKE